MSEHDVRANHHHGGRPGDGEVGIALQSDKAPGAYAALARAAEASGVDVVSVYADLGFQPPLPALLEIAAATSRVRVGPACLNPYVLHPVEIAGQLAALDLAADGRAYLGIAPGTWLDAVGVERRNPARAVEEATAIVGALLRGDTDGVRGATFRLEPGFELRYERRRPSVPLLIGAWGPALAAVAGRVADELKVGGSSNPAMVAVMRERVAVGARAVGRDPDDVGIVLGAVSVVDEDGERARAIARTEVAMYLAVVAELDPTFRVPPAVLARVRTLVEAGDHRRAGAAIPDEVLDRFAFSGTPEHVAALVRGALDAGARRVDLGTPHGISVEAGIELIGRRVLPLVGGARRAQTG
jgi:5,10-methylenetetrahydromethanopterin reductase